MLKKISFAKDLYKEKAIKKAIKAFRPFFEKISFKKEKNYFLVFFESKKLKEKILKEFVNYVLFLTQVEK